MSPTAKELVGSNLVPEGTRFVISQAGAERINADHGHEVVKRGDVLTYLESHQERVGGPPIYYREDRTGTIAIPHGLDAFSSCSNLPEWFTESQEQGRA